jgi:hypothetical protein
MPLFPDGRKAVIDFFGIETNVAQSIIYFQIPDYRARIDNLTISGRDVKIDLKSKLSFSELSLKLYADQEKATYYHERTMYSMKTSDIDITSSVYEHKFEKDFDYLLVSLSLKSTGEMIDYRGYNLSWGYQEGVEVSYEDIDLAGVIQRGENLVTEFKLELSEEFLETVIAFANSKGGLILLGVNDNCQVIGYKPKSDDQISNLIASNVDPRPHFTVFSRIIDEKEITVVDVTEGDNKPYCHRQKGFYIRSNANDRHPTRSEMDSFYPSRQEDPYDRFR